MTASLSDGEASALAAVDEAAIGRLLLELLVVPSVTGSGAESEMQHVLARHLERMDLDVDLWSMNLPELRAHPQFPGSEARARRRGAWWVVRGPRATGRPWSSRDTSTSSLPGTWRDGRATPFAPGLPGTWCTHEERAT
ncbi:hypothetical protein SAMN06272781_8184 [Streptomyces sp. 1222.2]|nr:hypothetical protein SAMN06272781_8184 [Streptomyces sp. 1222.2]